MDKFSNKAKLFIGMFSVITVLVVLAGVFYLYLLPNLVSNEKVISAIEKMVEKNFNAKLQVTKPVLKTNFSSNIDFSVAEILLQKENKKLFYLDNLDVSISFVKLAQKKIVLDKIGIDDIYIDANGLITLFEQPKTNQPQKPIEWTVEWLNSLFYIKNCLVLYDLDKTTHMKILGKNMTISNTREPKLVRFDLTIDVDKQKPSGNDKVVITLSDKDSVYIKNHKLYVDKGLLGINDSSVFIDAESDENANFELLVYSHDFDLKDAAELLETNIVIPNGEEMLSYFKDINGKFDFNIKLTNDDINGVVNVKKSGLKVIQLSNLPVIIEKGLVEINKKSILLKNFEGWYGKHRRNVISFFGNVDDYTNSVDTTIEAVGLATNDFAKNYLSQVVGIPITLIGDSEAKVLLKSKYNKIDITYMGKIAKGDDILVDGASLSPVDYDRAIIGDFHLDGNNLDIKSIKYYIAKELNKETKGVKPILTIDGNVDIATLDIKKLGFDIPNPLPSEFLNVLIGQKLFKNGKIFGHMYYIGNSGNPKLEGYLTMDKVLIPSQRMSIQSAKVKTNNNSINLNAKGRFKRSKYTFNGDIKNSLLFPFVVKDVLLSVDNIDIDKILTSMNNQNTTAVSSVGVQEASSVSKTLITVDNSASFDENDEKANDAYTFDTGLLIVEKCVLEVVKGFYKEIKFGNLKANLTLNKDGILEVKSNRFDFAEGISSLKILCDLKKHLYNIKLGVKDINSDQIATTLLALPREISGKASGLIELNTDATLKLNGRIRFDVQNGTIQKVGLVEYALKFAALFRNPITMISPSTIIDLVNIPDGNFDKINGDLVLKNNVVEKIMIKSSASQLSSFIIGRYDLETKDASLRIYTKFSNKNRGFAGFLRNISLNSLANSVSFGKNSENMYYAMELEQLPPIDADEKDCQVFLTKVDGDVENFNFLSSLKKIK